MEVLERSDATFTKAYFIEESSAGLNKSVTEYLGKYPPPGYATYFEMPPEETEHGLWIAVLKRYNTCE